MNHQKNTVSNFDFRELILKPVIPSLIFALVVAVLLSGFLRDALRNGWQEMTDLISVEVYRAADGRIEQYSGNTFPVVSRGDRLIVRIPLHEERKVGTAVLGFNIPHVAGYACYGDTVLWSYGQDLYEQGKYLGNLFFCVPVEDGMWGGTVELRLTVTENNAFSSINNVQAMPAASSLRYFFSQFQMDMFLFLGFFTLACTAFIILLFYGKKGDLREEGLWLSAFCMLMGAWFLSSHGFLYLFTDSIVFCAHTEYIAFYLMPVPFCRFVRVQVKRDRRFRMFLDAMTIFFSVVFVIVTVLNYTTAEYHYTTFLMPLQGCMLFGVVAFVVMLIQKQYAEDLSSMVIRYGVAISMLILMLELARYNISKYFFVVLEEMSFASTGMLVFAGTLTLGYVARLADAVGEQSDKALLRRMAYVDVLTGIANRAYCNQKIQEMESSGETRFAILFFDMNGLKRANDRFGHDMGDLYLQTVAASLQKVFGQQYFCGRWGGDEFIVCLTDASVRYAESMLRDFHQELTDINESGRFPFPVSVAYGIVRSSEREPIALCDAIKEADRRMYLRKDRMYEMEKSLGRKR